MGLVLGLLLVFFGPPLALLLLGLRFRKLSHLADLTGRARTTRLVWLAVLAGGLTLVFYLVVLLVSARIPSAHGAGRSAWPWGQEHPITTVLLASLAVTLLLVRQPAQRPAGLSFGAGALVVLGGLGMYWYFTAHQQDVKLDAFL